MKNILVITEHPAPYWDKTFSELEKLSYLNVIYIKSEVQSKPWKNEKHHQGIIFRMVNFNKIIRLIFESDQIILGGIYLKQLIFLLILSLCLFKKVALFSDVPEKKKRNWVLNIFKYILFRFFNLFLVSGNEGIIHYNVNYKIPLKRIIYFPYAWNEHNTESPNFQERPLRVFISNRFLERKGYDTLYNVFVELINKKTISDFTFKIAGDGPLFIEYSNKFKDLVDVKYHLLGWIDYDKYLNELNNCHILFNPSKFEPFGIPILDALSRGKIVISTNMVMSANDFIQDQKNGFLFNVDDRDSIIKIFIHIAADRFNLALISKSAKNFLPKYSTFIKEFLMKIKQ
ncbi:MAG: glycosyltransferase family 4 protein [Ignavibacterium sp.]|nr:glycosyltransferase family 4 protein [Ignavibacterium sp.]